jgi:hypothetical protein
MKQGRTELLRDEEPALVPELVTALKLASVYTQVTEKPPSLSTPPTQPLMSMHFPTAPKKVFCRVCFKNSHHINY